MQQELLAACRVRRSRFFVRLTAACCGALSPLVAAQEPVTWLPLHSSEHRLVVVDNSPVAKVWWASPARPHAAGFNGIGLLAHSTLERNLVAPGLAALNFEHIFSGDESSYGYPGTAPRLAPMTLEARAFGQRLELSQAFAGAWPLRTEISFERVDPEAIDIDIACTPFEDVWSKHGYIGIFFASYIDAPADPAIYFIGRSRPGQGDPTPRWIRHVPPRYGQQMNHRPAGSDWDPPIDPGMHIGPIEGFSSFEYLYPMYFGVTQGKAMIFMFDSPERGELRFAQTPNGGGLGNPAWDFFYMHRHYVVGETFVLHVRLVCKEFIDFEDVIQLYEAWSGRPVVRP